MMENTQELWALIGSYALTGAIISSIIQATKNWLSSRNQKVVWTILISMTGGIVIYYFNLLPGHIILVLAGIFASAETFYTLIFKTTEK